MKHLYARLRARVQKLVCCQIPSRYLNTVKFPHPVGVVIGDGVRIGSDCRIYQNVTIGLLENTLAPAAKGQYPVLEDGVIVFAGAVIVGPIRIGAGAVIGANAIVTRNVPPGFVAFGYNQFRRRRTTRDDQPGATASVNDPRIAS
jgi:serine acetyltransferase